MRKPVLWKQRPAWLKWRDTKHVEGKVKQKDELDCVDLNRRAKGFRYYSESDEKQVTVWAGQWHALTFFLRKFSWVAVGDPLVRVKSRNRTIKQETVSIIQAGDDGLGVIRAPTECLLFSRRQDQKIIFRMRNRIKTDSEIWTLQVI